MRSWLIILVLVAILLSGCKPAPKPSPPSPPAPAPSPSLAPVPSPPSLRPGLWYVTRGEAKSDQAWGVGVDKSGNIYTAGYYQSPASALFYDMVIYKFSLDGRELWRTQWGDKFQEKAFVVAVSEPYIYIGGLTHTTISLTEADMAVLALDMNTGKVLWTAKWGQGFGYEEVDGLVVDGDFIYVSGWTTGEKTSGDMGLLKLQRSDGKLIWAKAWGTDKFDSADGQMVVDREAIYVSGRINGTNILGGGQAVIARFSKETGAYLEHRAWGGPVFSDGLGMTSDGKDLYVVGLTLDRGNGGQIFLLKYDKKLNLLWEQVWGGKGGESARDAKVDAAGNILIAGSTESYGAGETDIVLLQYSPEGKLNWDKVWGGPQRDTVQGLAIDGDFVYLVGSTENKSQGMNDALLIKADARTGQFPPP